MSSLDAGMYPHLISLIVDLASHESLIYLRATCRAFRIHADMNLNAGRLIVTPVAAGEQRVVVSSECGRIPAFAGWALSPPPPNIDELATPSHDDEEPAHHGPNDDDSVNYLRESKGSDALSSVFIFHHASKPCLGAAPEDELDFTSLVMYSEDDMLDIVFSGIASSLVDGMKVTVVGVDVIAESRWLKNMDENLVGVDDRHNLRVLVWLQCFQPGRWSLIDHGHWPNLEFKTMDEFLASVPVSRDAALETTREGRL
ncbi:hypothetical protein CcaverHIS002_0113280 [Cutaneotrichosporon cavernicola]|nr:hypothetical protein CcaverHIS002_0113280 [Cutaneotrichosporon cavernicola]